MTDTEYFDGVAYLASKGLHGKQGNGPEMVYPCFMDCGEPADSKKKKWYYNAAENFYYCQVCNVRGGSYLLQKFFGDDPQPGKGEKEGINPLVRREILDDAALVGAQWLTQNDEALLYLLDERGLSEETIIRRRLGLVQKPWSLTGNLTGNWSKEQIGTTGLIWRDGANAGRDFFYNHILIPYVEMGSVVQMRGRAFGDAKGGKYLTGPGDGVRLYNADDLKIYQDIIVTEGEFDGMVLKQTLETAPDNRARSLGVVSMAGTGALPENFESYFNETRIVYLGLDPDDAGKRATVKLKEMLGPKARIIELPEGLPKTDWTNFIHDQGHSWQDVMQLVGKASGKRVFSMSEAGHAFRSQEQEGGARIACGFPSLDALTEGGWKPGEVVIVLAKTGTGKTVLLCNWAYNMRDKRVLFVSLEMTREEVYGRMKQIFSFYQPGASEATLERALQNVFICDENRLSEKDLEDIIAEFEIESGGSPDVVMVDYLGYYARGQSGSSNYEKISNAVMQLKAEAKKGRYVMIVPAQVNRSANEGKPIDLDDARDSGAIEETADFLLSIWRPSDALKQQDLEGNVVPTATLKMTVLKARRGPGKDRVVNLLMDPLTIALVEERTKQAGRVKRNYDMMLRGGTYADYLARAAMGTQEKMKLAAGEKE